MKYRPSKRFALGMCCLCPLGVALYSGMVPELGKIEHAAAPGEIVFRSERPPRMTAETAIAAAKPPSPFGSRGVWSVTMDWLGWQFDNLMSWERNPWKAERNTFGSHYLKMLESKDPVVMAKVKELKRLGDALLKRVLERYPELAVPDKQVPAERNGFLRWLEFAERFKADSKDPAGGFRFPEDITKHLAGEKPWDATAVRAWLDGERANLDQIRAIGLMPEQSSAGIDVERFSFLNARLVKSSAEMLLLDARLAAEEGDTARALESIRAANGLADHFGQVETPSLLAVTIEILIRLQTQAYALKEVMPALPAGQMDPQAWQEALNPTVSPPADLARIMRGEYHVTAREYIMPMLMDTEDPKYPDDPDALIDVNSGFFSRFQDIYASNSPADWTKVTPPGVPDLSHLSRSSRDLIEMMFVGAGAWSNGTLRAQSSFGMNQAAFAILQGRAIPRDPIYGLAYGWDAATRTLSPPDSKEFKEMKLKAIVVPRP